MMSDMSGRSREIPSPVLRTHDDNWRGGIYVCCSSARLADPIHILPGNFDPMIRDSFGRIDYDETGAGPTVVLVPGSCSTGAAWRPIMTHWEHRFRCVTTSLSGYG